MTTIHTGHKYQNQVELETCLDLHRFRIHYPAMPLLKKKQTNNIIYMFLALDFVNNVIQN